MPSLVVQHASEPSGETLDGTLNIGRGADNDVVLDHPTVSRHHAVIERVGGEYFLSDLGSKNRTRVGGRTVRERRQLQNGDRIRFGQVRVTFVIGDDGNGTATLDRGDSPTLEPGVLFNCECGERLWARAEAAGGVVSCEKCNASVVVPAKTKKGDSGETVSGMSVVTQPEGLAAPVQTGTCSICQWETTSDDEITACPSCRLTFHAECWKANCGCSAYGCSQVNALPAPQPKRQRPAQPGLLGEPAPEAQVEEVAPAIAAIEPAEPKEGHAGRPLDHALLAASIVGSVLGLLAFGALSIATLVASAALLARGRANRRLIIVAAVMSAVGAAAGVMMSAVWWLGWSPGS